LWRISCTDSPCHAIVQHPLAAQAVLTHLAPSAAPVSPGPAPPAPPTITCLVLDYAPAGTHDQPQLL